MRDGLVLAVVGLGGAIFLMMQPAVPAVPFLALLALGLIGVGMATRDLDVLGGDDDGR